jgi:predicted Fe-Mo cluster-binding NifX family protein
MDPRFGRARYFLVVDTESGQHTVHTNETNLNAVQGAGIQTGRCVIRLGVAAVVTGNVGPKAFATLEAGNIPVYTAQSGTIREVVEQFKAGNLRRAASPNVEGHWGT